MQIRPGIIAVSFMIYALLHSCLISNEGGIRAVESPTPQLPTCQGGIPIPGAILGTNTLTLSQVTRTDLRTFPISILASAYVETVKSESFKYPLRYDEWYTATVLGSPMVSIVNHSVIRPSVRPEIIYSSPYTLGSELKLCNQKGVGTYMRP